MAGDKIRGGPSVACPTKLIRNQAFERRARHARAPAEAERQQPGSGAGAALRCLLQIEQVGARRMPRLQRHHGISDATENNSQLVIEIVRGSGGHGVSVIGLRYSFHTA